MKVSLPRARKQRSERERERERESARANAGEYSVLCGKIEFSEVSGRREQDSVSTFDPHSLARSHDRAPSRLPAHSGSDLPAAEGAATLDPSDISGSTGKIGEGAHASGWTFRREGAYDLLSQLATTTRAGSPTRLSTFAVTAVAACIVARHH